WPSARGRTQPDQRGRGARAHEPRRAAAGQGRGDPGGRRWRGVPGRATRLMDRRALLHWLPASIRDTRAMRSRRHLRPRPAPRSAFAGYRFPPEVITLAVRWYLRFGLSYRDVEELLAERGVEVDHVTVYRWVQRF